MTDRDNSPEKREVFPLDDATDATLEKNLAVLKERFPAAEAKTREADCSAFVFQKTTEGALSIGKREPSGNVRWTAGDEEEQEALAGARQETLRWLKQRKARVYVQTGFGSGRFAQAILMELKEYNAPVLVVEPDAAVFQAALRLREQGEVLGSGKFFFAVGEDFLDQAEAILERYRICVVPEFCLFFRSMRLTAEQRKQYIAWTEEINTRRRRLADALDRRVVEFLNRPRTVSADSIRKVWLLERTPDCPEYTRVQYHLARKLTEAIKHAGCEVCGPEYQPQTYYPPFHAVQDFMESEADLALLINAFSTDLSVFGENFTERLQIPKVSWFMDAPITMRDRLKKHGLAAADVLASTDAHWFEDVADVAPGLAERTIHALPLAATYDNEGPLDAAWAGPVSYVGQVRDVDAVLDRSTIADYIRQALYRMAEVIAQNRYERPIQLIQNSPELADLRQRYDLLSFFRTYFHHVIWEAESRHRVQTLQPLADQGLQIYGNPEWTPRIQGTPLEACFTGKTVAHDDLPRLYRNSQINVNIHHVQSSTSLNQRMFDVPASGGFLITEYLPGLEELFEPEREVVFYRTPEELREKVQHYLERPDQCREIAERARARVLRDHTFAERWRQLLEILRGEGWA